MKKPFTFLLIFIISHTAIAQMHHWTGNGGDNNWFNSLNWDIEAVPVAGSTASISGNYNVEIIDGPAFAAIIDMYENASLSIENDVTLTQAIFTESTNTIYCSKQVS